MGTILLVSAVVLLSPGFLGYWVTLVALIFIRRGNGWLRWLFTAVVVWRGVSIAFTYPGHSLALTSPFTYMQLALLLASAVAVALLFSASANVWFRNRASPVVKDDASSARDVL